jgi:ribosomal protein L11 methyltransferase
LSAFLQLSFELGALAVQTAEDTCFACGASSVTFVDAQDDSVLEPLPGEFRLWPTTRLRALFADVVETNTLVAILSAALNIPQDAIEAQEIEDRVWEREWLRDFHAMRFGQRLWICPSHEEVTAPDGLVVRMDPGLAFGTGTHPTTAMCLEWLDRNLHAGQRVIDYGCGSGILAVAALKLGAREAHCFDIDPQAMIATSDNARANDVDLRLTLCPSRDALPRDADVLVANILCGPLCELAPDLAPLLRQGGAIVLAGLLAHEAYNVTQAYGAWFDIHPFETREGWVGLSGTRHS